MNGQPKNIMPLLTLVGGEVIKYNLKLSKNKTYLLKKKYALKNGQVLKHKNTAT